MRTSEFIYRLLPERLAVSVQHLRHAGRWPDLKNPRTLNEKILHKRLYVRDDRMIPLMDKALVKQHIADTIGISWVIPTLFAGPELPPREQRTWATPYMIKSTHGSSQFQLVDVADPDWDRLERLCASWSAETRWPYTKWPYTEIEKRVIVEPFIGENGKPPPDYKFFVFDGQVRAVQADIDRWGDHHTSYFDRDWNLLNITRRNPSAGKLTPPNSLDAMIKAAEALGSGFDFVRVDLYETSSGPRFGEMTFFPGSGYKPFGPLHEELKLGSYWQVTDGRERTAAP